MWGNPQSRVVEGQKIQFEQQGHGPAMVLLHGLLGYSFSWRRVLGAFADSREVFALDMPGSGFSDCSPELDPHLSAAAERLLKFLDAVDVGSCDLVGSSYGGTTALFLAATHPERVRTLTLVSPANPWSHIGRKRLALLNVQAFGRAFPAIARAFRPLHRLSIKRMYGDRSRLTAETLRGYSLPLVRKGVFEHAAKIARCWHADMAELMHVLPGAADIPTLILWGTRDRLVDLTSAEILRTHFRSATIELINGAGHLPYEECPEEFAAAVRGFLAKYPPR